MLSGHLAKILKTATFRLAAIYACVFAGLLLISAVGVFYLTHSALKRQLYGRMSSEMESLKADYANGGLTELIKAIHDHEHVRISGPLRYRLSDASGRNVAGDLASVSPESGWSEMDFKDGSGELARFAVLTNELGGGEHLTVAGNLEDIDEARDVVFQTFAAALTAVLVLGLLGGLGLGAVVLHRVDTVTRTADQIIAGGDLSLRVPTRGTGDDFDRLASSLNRMLDRVSELMDSVRQISNDVAHDLRTPLTRLHQRLERTLVCDQSAANYRAAIERSLAEVEEILTTFGALLRIAQVETGSRRAGFRPLDLSEVFLSVVEAFQPSAEEAGHAIVAHSDPDLWLQGDRELLVQMAANLIENAIHHTPAGTRIEIDLRRRSTLIVVTVRDDGPGVPEDERDRVFQRFYRLDKSRSSFGNGLGLSMVRAIADLHQAEIRILDNLPGMIVSIQFVALNFAQAHSAMPNRDAEGGGRTGNFS